MIRDKKYLLVLFIFILSFGFLSGIYAEEYHTIDDKYVKDVVIKLSDIDLDYSNIIEINFKSNVEKEDLFFVNEWDVEENVDFGNIDSIVLEDIGFTTELELISTNDVFEHTYKYTVNISKDNLDKLFIILNDEYNIQKDAFLKGNIKYDFYIVKDEINWGTNLKILFIDAQVINFVESGNNSYKNNQNNSGNQDDEDDSDSQDDVTHLDNSVDKSDSMIIEYEQKTNEHMSIENISVFDSLNDSKIRIEQYKDKELFLKFNVVFDEYFLENSNQNILDNLYANLNPYIEFKEGFRCNNVIYPNFEGEFTEVVRGKYLYEGKVLLDSDFYDSFNKCGLQLLKSDVYLKINVVAYTPYLNQRIDLDFNAPCEFDFSKEFDFVYSSINSDLIHNNYGINYGFCNLDSDKSLDFEIITSLNSNFDVLLEIYGNDISKNSANSSERFILNKKLTLNKEDVIGLYNYNQYSYNINLSDAFSEFKTQFGEDVYNKMYFLNFKVINKDTNQPLHAIFKNYQNKYYVNNIDKINYFFVDKEHPFKFHNLLNACVDSKNCEITRGGSFSVTTIQNKLDDYDYDSVANEEIIVDKNNNLSYKVTIKKRVKLFGIIPLPFSKKETIIIPYE